MNRDSAGRKTERAFWNDAHQGRIRYRLPSPLNIGTANILRLLEPRISTGARVLEIGFAPGKILVHLGLRCGANVFGIDYSENGVAVAKDLFQRLGLAGDLRCEDLFSSSFAEQTFDFVYSLGLVEHFDNAAVVVEQHFRFLRPGGRALIAIPNYGGVYGSLQARLDSDNLAIHNLHIMRTDVLCRLTEGLAVSSVRAYPFGRLSPWLLSIDRKLPRPVALGLQGAANLVGLLQPIDVARLCPLLVLEFTRASA